MKRNDFYILQNQDGVIYAYTDDFKQVWYYMNYAREQGFTYTSEKNGIATIYTFFKDGLTVNIKAL